MAKQQKTTESPKKFLKETTKTFFEYCKDKGNPMSNLSNIFKTLMLKYQSS